MHIADGKQTTIQLDNEVILSLQKDLALFSRAADALRQKLAQLVPASYGSDAWWEQSIERSKKDVAAGKYTSFDSAGDFVRYLDSIAP